MKQIFKVCLLLTIFNTCLISLIFAQVRTKIFRNGIPIQLLSEKGSNPPEISINPPENFMQMKANKKTTSGLMKDLILHSDNVVHPNI